MKRSFKKITGFGGGIIVEFVQCTVWSLVDDVGVGVGVAWG